jgi:hypothetical protein
MSVRCAANASSWQSTAKITRTRSAPLTPAHGHGFDGRRLHPADDETAVTVDARLVRCGARVATLVAIQR